MLTVFFWGHQQQSIRVLIELQSATRDDDVRALNTNHPSCHSRHRTEHAARAANGHVAVSHLLGEAALVPGLSTQP